MLKVHLSHFMWWIQEEYLYLFRGKQERKITFVVNSIFIIIVIYFETPHS